MFTKNRFAPHNLLHICISAALAVLIVLYGCSDQQSGEKAKTGDASPQEKEWLSILGGVMGGSFSTIRRGR